jgi:hypothetical protein
MVTNSDVADGKAIGEFLIFQSMSDEPCDLALTAVFSQSCSKPETTQLEYAWASAVWNPEFTRFLHEFMRSDKNNFCADLRIDAQGDVPVGAVFRAAVESRMPVEFVPFPHGSHIDIGTLADLSVRQRVIDRI